MSDSLPMTCSISLFSLYEYYVHILVIHVCVQLHVATYMYPHHCGSFCTCISSKYGHTNYWNLEWKATKIIRLTTLCDGYYYYQSLYSVNKNIESSTYPAPVHHGYCSAKPSCYWIASMQCKDKALFTSLATFQNRSHQMIEYLIFKTTFLLCSGEQI